MATTPSAICVVHVMIYMSQTAAGWTVAPGELFLHLWNTSSGGEHPTDNKRQHSARLSDLSERELTESSVEYERSYHAHRDAWYEYGAGAGAGAAAAAGAAVAGALVAGGGARRFREYPFGVRDYPQCNDFTAVILMCTNGCLATFKSVCIGYICPSRMVREAKQDCKQACEQQYQSYRPHFKPAYIDGVKQKIEYP